MTAFELMETVQKNGKAEENTNTPNLILNKFLISSSAVATPPPESIDFFKDISISALRLTNLDQIIEDECFQEDPSLTPLIQTPPQSAASSINLSESLSINSRKDYLALNLEFRKKHTEFKLKLENSLKKFKRIQDHYFLSNYEYFSTNDLNYEFEKQKENSDNDLTDEEEEEDQTNNNLQKTNDSYWQSRRLRLGSEWQRVKQKLNLLKNKNLNVNLKRVNNNKNLKLINLKKELENLTDRYKPALKYFENNITKSNCVCELKLTEKETCIFCNLNLIKSIEEPKKINRPIDFINFDHSYTKLPNYSNQNNKNNKNETKLLSNDLDFLDTVDDEILNKLVNERLNNLYSPAAKIENRANLKLTNDVLPKFTNEDLMQIFDEQNSRESDDEKFIPLKKPKIESKSYNQSKFKQLRNYKNSKKRNFGENFTFKNSIKRSIRSRSSSSTVYSINEACIKSSNRYDIDNMFISDEIVSCHKISPISNPKITTPTWRELSIEPIYGENKPDEEINDANIIDRHKISELKEKLGYLNKNLIESSKDDNFELDANFNGNSQSNLEWPERNFPLAEEEYRKSKINS